jgi:hypothetical protein
MRTTLFFAVLLLGPSTVFAQEASPDDTATDTLPEALPEATDEAPPVVVSTGDDGFTLGVLPHVGMTIPTSKLGVYVVAGLEVDVALPILDRRLILALDASLTRPSHDGSETDPRVGGAYDFEVKESELKVGLSAVYRVFGKNAAFVPFVGLGPILHMLRTTQTNSLAPGENTEEDTRLGVEVVLGVDFRLGPGALTAEGRMVYSSLDHVMTGDSNAGNVTLSTGYRLLF